MNGYRHHVSGVFPHIRDAENAFRTLNKQGLPTDQLSMSKSDSTNVILSRRNSVLQDILMDGFYGILGGLAIGTLGILALLLIDITMFYTSPWVIIVMLLGWSSSLGALIGMIFGATKGPGLKTGWLADLFKKSILQDDVVLLMVKTETERETIIARRVLQTSAGDFRDANMGKGTDNSTM